ncbi:bifunctional methylenetetrahydrofolate dehydrogenase/methenyltetrahydrofolate cyclohydrolase FolD [Candidatus Phycosocius spiralis]|uniref:Bifunctional protein FolD n=1 Tax=Candidatus Phycosocius spiralis TaxID=2815099 RepID=A0ABQ4PXT7_9PROT|nr:bifunctional methylenetetrahydrofolate dehydrogenase/methenyltetrahydrofolate cyclohydrolase FolD [Candidatus Phycosocius spiralis]GIU67730.1 bifunctional protein FolD [Candidatus Phycosocius spiralis]
MVARMIDGKAMSAALEQTLEHAVANLVKAYDVAPCLYVVLVGEDPASQVYVRNKTRRTLAVGMRSIEIKLPATISQSALEDQVKALSRDPDVDGILVQLPLPAGLNSDAVIACIDPAKDVDGLTEVSAGRLLLGRPGLRPCTPTGCVILAKHSLGDLSGSHVVVIGRSILVGKPAGLLFLAQDCTVTLAHSRTKNLADVCKSADILVPAVGCPEMVKASWIKPGATVIDVGINKVADPRKGQGAARLVGDVAYEEALEVAGAITPVPGGVGPMTIACLLHNTVLAACARRGWANPDLTAAKWPT